MNINIVSTCWQYWKLILLNLNFVLQVRKTYTLLLRPFSFLNYVFDLESVSIHLKFKCIEILTSIHLKISA